MDNVEGTLGSRAGRKRATARQPRTMSRARGWLLPLCLGACAAPAVNAQGEAGKLTEVIAAASELCTHPENLNAYLDEGDTVEGVIEIRILGVEIVGRLPSEMWNTLPELLEPFDPSQRVACVERVLPLLIRAFDEIGPGEEGATAEDAARLNACVAETIAQDMARPFSITGGVRCPGGGCLFRSGRCNRRSTSLRYETLPGYFVDEYQFIQGPTHHGNTGGLSLEVEVDDSGRLQRIAISLSCDPPNHPGAAGGWNRGELTGMMSYIDLGELRRRALEECTVTIGR